MAGMSDRITFFGGPMDGQYYPATTSRAVIVPDARDRVFVADPAGYSGMVFGRHTYERLSYSDGTEMLVHLRYERPVPVNDKAVYEEVEWHHLPSQTEVEQ